MKRMVWMIPVVMVMACATGLPRFQQYPGEMEKTVTQTLPYGYDAVWAGVGRAVDGYRVHTMSREEGVVITRWRMRVVPGVGQIGQSRNYVNGSGIDDYSHSVAAGEEKEFELHNRLVITVVPAGDSTVVTLTNRFWGQPHDYFGDSPVSSGDKAFSTAALDMHDEYAALEIIRAVAEKKQAK